MLYIYSRYCQLHKNPTEKQPFFILKLCKSHFRAVQVLGNIFWMPASGADGKDMTA